MGHSNCVHPLAAGMKALPSGDKAFAHTQGLWRFLGNERVTPADLGAPLLELARAGVVEGCDEYALAVHDWSRLNYNSHSRKQDRLQMTHATDVGYELQSTVLVADRDGAPLGAPVQNLRTAQGVWSSRNREMVEPEAHLDELTQRMDWLDTQAFAKPLVHLVDREADSVFHQRQWSARNRLWLVRAKAAGRVRCGLKTSSLQQVADGLCFAKVRPVAYQGQPAVQWLASAEVTIVRPAKRKRVDEQGKRVPPIPGAPMTVRLVVSRVCTPDGKPLADWFLLTNVPGSVPDARIALWYYWRWRIESYFKLLKQAGQQLERWEQESGPAILKRLLIAGQACALAWRLMRAEGTFADQTRAFLVRLSGRQMKRTTPISASALLHGLYTLFAMLETLKNHSTDELQRFAQLANNLAPDPSCVV